MPKLNITEALKGVGRRERDLVRVPVKDELWTTLDRRVLAVADMSEDHVRNALRHVIFNARYRRLARDMLFLQEMSDDELMLAQLTWPR